MTSVETMSVQTACAAFGAAPTLPCITHLANLVEGVVAVTVAAVIYCAYPLLVTPAVVWCLTILSVALFRLTLSSKTQKATELDSTDVIKL